VRHGPEPRQAGCRTGSRVAPTTSSSARSESWLTRADPGDSPCPAAGRLLNLQERRVRDDMRAGQEQGWVRSPQRKPVEFRRRARLPRAIEAGILRGRKYPNYRGITWTSGMRHRGMGRCNRRDRWARQHRQDGTGSAEPAARKASLAWQAVTARTALAPWAASRMGALFTDAPDRQAGAAGRPLWSPRPLFVGPS